MRELQDVQIKSIIYSKKNQWLKRDATLRQLTKNVTNPSSFFSDIIHSAHTLSDISWIPWSNTLRPFNFDNYISKQKVCVAESWIKNICMIPQLWWFDVISWSCFWASSVEA
ncbi:7025_t:CDS:2 [Ambispora gerdemannii]|uniref:7025_t:CDS:1 n=1 Tax=Ambispora gerdemannii TaxID=144530 RepID=A0A9N8W4I1_9GLOM|nr:7025_t:CDS:2 [Ambispora gerdemannii]